MKKGIALLLVIAMLFSLPTVGLAAQNEETSRKDRIQTGLFSSIKISLSAIKACQVSCRKCNLQVKTASIGIHIYKLPGKE